MSRYFQVSLRHLANLFIKVRYARWIKIDYLLVAAIGIVFLLVSYCLIYRGAVLSDEIVYTVVARNIVEQGHLNTNLYRADSIVARGYPTRDVHVPGYMLTLAAAFALFGVNEVAVGLPSQVAYVLAGLIFYKIGKFLFEPAIAFWAALLFYVYPINFIFANLVMVESFLNLLTVIFMAYWLMASRMDIPRLSYTIILAVILIMGMVYRQTFVVFLLPTLLILIKSGFIQKNYRPLMVFGLLFTILLFGLYWPLAQNRAYYPSAFDQAVETEDWLTAIDLLKRNFFNNISLTSVEVNEAYYLALINLVLGLVATISGLWFIRTSQKTLTILFLYLFWVPLFMFTIFYMPILHLTTARNMSVFLLPGLLLFIAVIFKVKQLLIRYACVTMIIVGMGLFSIRITKATTESQDETIYYQQTASNLIAKYLKSYAPQTIMFPEAFKAAWDHYPVVIVWSNPTTYKEMQILQERLPIDAIVVNSERERDIILDAGAAGLLKQRYISLFPYKVEGFYFLVSEHLQLQTNEHAP